MGPQLDSCGRAVKAPMIRGAMSLLQWGRNLTVAEGRSIALNCPFTMRLQWGRNLTVAEGG